MDKKKVYITGLARTPLGCPGMSLERFASSDLAAKVIKALLERQHLDPSAVGQVVFGQSLPSTMPNNIGHYAWLKAELPVEVPGYTVQANASSGLQALRNAYNLIATGNEEIVLAGGADSYSAAPFVMRDVRLHFYPQDRFMIDSLDEAECCTQPEPMSRLEQFEAAHGKERSEEEKAFAAAGEEKAARLKDAEADVLVPMSYTDRKKVEVVIAEDEWPGKVKEGPLSPRSDCAAAALLASEKAVKAYGLAPIAELCGFAYSGSDPKHPERAGAAAGKKLLEAQGLTAEDIAYFEIRENSAADVLAIAAALGIPLSRINPFGGALAFGNCDGAEGLLMVSRLAAALKSGERGLIMSYSAGGMGLAALIKNGD